ncbi:MAG: HsdM family class I SAM-dependent methyltransferase [Candidatus Asgardarchaeia archaeon]
MSVRPGELTFQGDVLHWIKEIIESENLPFDDASQEVIMERQERPDIVIWEDKKTKKAALLLSLKTPYYDPWDAADDAYLKASKWPGGIRYFATWNINKFFLWDRHKGDYLYDMLCYQKEVANISKIEDYEAIEPSLRKFIKDFLIKFAKIYSGEEEFPALPIDEKFIYRLRSAIDVFSIGIEHAIKEKAKDNDFKMKLINWFSKQGWTFSDSEEDYRKIARQYVYLLINKIVFYNVLRSRYPDLPEISLPKTLNGEELRKELQKYFNRAIRIDYETIFTTDFLDTIPIPDNLVERLIRFIEKVGEYDYTKIGYEVIGRIFERLIPDKERHTLGQYYTRSDVVDLIVGFCVRNADDVVLDGACGAGTFLVRAYMRKKTLNPLKTHEELLEELYGIDIAKFPAHLATINLAVRDLSSEMNYPRIIMSDFFDVKVGTEISPLGGGYQYEVRPLNLEKLRIEIPEVDAVIMNPPYTRQEIMEDISEEEKNKAHTICIKDWKVLSSEKYKGKNPKLSKRSSIYVYFFIHGASFLKEGGRLGFITSNSWLDVNYGYDLQRFFLENFKIIAIIESKIERWFEDADINTAITILEMCSNAVERNSNLVKFVQLKKPLVDFIQPTGDESKRWKHIEELIKLIKSKDEYYEDECIRVFPKLQKDLWEEGYDEEKGSYVGSKWGKYIRVPHILRIIERVVKKLVRLGGLCEIRPGCYSGINDFFYLTPNRISKFSIEEEFKIPIIRSPRQVNFIKVDIDSINSAVFACNMSLEELRQKGKYGALRYIEWGSKQVTRRRQKVEAGIPWPEVETVKNRKPGWWAIPSYNLEPTNLFMPYVIYERFVIPYSERPITSDRCFHRIFSKSLDVEVLSAILNSTFTILMICLIGRETLGQGALKFETTDAKRLLIPNPKKLDAQTKQKIKSIFRLMVKRSTASIFEEIGANSPEEVSLDKVKPDRRELDKVIMGDILGLTEEEQLEVYRAVIDLVRSRIEKARSVPKKKKRIKGIDMEALADNIADEIGRIKKFPDDIISFEGMEYKVISLPRGEAEIGQDLVGAYVKIGGKEIRCESFEEAVYIRYSLLNGKTEVKIPKDKNLVFKAVQEYKPIIEEAKRKIDEVLNSMINNRKVRDKVRELVWLKITGQR